jgi:RND family efflux transporter MFP subunit
MKSTLVALSLAFFVAACRKSVAAPPAPPTVEVVEVTQADVPIDREWVATLQGFVNADIRPQVEGYVRKQVYREGAYVERGAVLFLIDPRNYKAALDQAKSMLDRNVALLEKARLDVKRDRQLIASDVIPRQQFDNDLAAEREAEAAVATSRAAVEQAALNHGWTQVTSPISGIVGLAQTQVGSLVAAATVMTTVSQVDPIKALFYISEIEYLKSTRSNRWVEPAPDADPALELILDDGTTWPRRGTVVAVNRQVDQRTGTIAVVASFPNPGNLLRPGQYGRIRASIDVRRNALLVPLRALNELQGSYQVAVVGADAKVSLRAVRVAEQVGNLAIVDQGLEPGQKVVVEGFLRVRPGMVVRATSAVAESTASAAPAASGGK